MPRPANTNRGGRAGGVATGTFPRGRASGRHLITLHPLPADLYLDAERYPVRWNRNFRCHGACLPNGQWFPVALVNDQWAVVVLNQDKFLPRQDRVGVWTDGRWVPVCKGQDGVLRPQESRAGKYCVRFLVQIAN